MIHQDRKYKLIEFINKIIDAIDSVIRNAKLDKTQQSFLEMEAELANKVRVQFLDALSGAVENYNAAEVTSEGVVENRNQIEVEESTTPKYSLTGVVAPSREELENKAPLPVVDISKPQTSGTFAERRKQILEKAKEVIKKPYLNRDTNTFIFLTSNSYTHAFNNIGEVQLNAAEHLPEFVQNAVLTHVEKPTHGNEYATNIFTFFAAAKNKNVLPVKLKVKAYDYRGQDIPQNIKEYFGNNPQNYTDSYDTVVLEVEEIEKSSLGSVKDIDQKDLFLDPKELYNISITDLLDLVKGDNRKYIPGDIRNQIEVDDEADPDLSLGADEALKQAQVDFIEEMKQTVDHNSRVLTSAARVNAQEWIDEYNLTLL